MWIPACGTAWSFSNLEAMKIAVEVDAAVGTVGG
jgi:hypothetical protein